MLGYIYKRVPLLFILSKYNIKKPLFKQPAVLAIMALLLFGVFNGKFDSNFDALLMLTEFLSYFCIMAIFININNNLTEINDTGFLNRAILTDQTTHRILFGLYFGSSFILTILILFLFVATFFVYLLITSDFPGSILTLISRINLLMLVSSLAIILSNYVKVNIFFSILFYIGIISLTSRETGLLGFIFGSKLSILDIKSQIYIPSYGSTTDSASFNAILTKALLYDGEKYYLPAIISVIFQSVFSFILLKIVFNKFNKKSPSFLKKSNIYIFMMLLYSMAAIYIITADNRV